MNADEALTFVEALLAAQGNHLNDLERQLFRGVWQDKSYKEIHHDPPACNRELEHIMRNVGPGLWKRLRVALEDKQVSKFTLKGTVERAQKRSLLSVQSEASPEASLVERSAASETGLNRAELNSTWDEMTPQQHWGSMPEVIQLYGRTKELDQLKERITLDGCRLIALFGTPGIGKTTLAAQLAHQVKDQFDYLIWQSLEYSPSLQTLIADLTQFFSNGQETATELTRLLYYLRHHSCFVVLDGLEAVLRGGVHNGAYQKGYEDYGELLKVIGQTGHRSCFVFTSSEKPKEVARMEGENQRVFALKLDGLGELAVREFLTAKGAFSCTDGDWRLIVHRYEGNPSALNTIATHVREVFDGDVKNFLEQLQQGTALFDDIRALLERQFNRLSELERTIVECLVKHHEPLSLAEILQYVVPAISNVEAQEVLQSLRRRSLIEGTSARYSLQTLMTEYVLCRSL
ncbi:MAG: NB-ARC domain-containing protein [Stenomitos frigidus ULC029]